MNIKFIHVGHHKCGSTFIQNEVIPVITSLKQLPAKKSNGETNLELKQAWIDLITKSELYVDIEKIENVFKEVDFNCISNEGFLGFGSSEASSGNHILQSAKRLKKIFGETNILLIIRNQKSLVKSYYLDDIEYGYSCSFKEWIEIKKQRNQLDWFKYSPIIKLYSELFGNDNVHVILFEELFKKKELIKFFNSIGIEPVGFQEINFNKKHNISIGFLTYYVSRLINPLIGTRANMGDGIVYKIWIDYVRVYLNNLSQKLGLKLSLDFDEYENIVDELFSEDNKLTCDLLEVDLSKYGYSVK